MSNDETGLNIVFSLRNGLFLSERNRKLILFKSPHEYFNIDIKLLMSSLMYI